MWILASLSNKEKFFCFYDIIKKYEGVIMKYKVFVIWQSQNKEVNNFIRDQLKKAKKN